MQITKNFSVDELKCRCCGECLMDGDFMKRLQLLRDVWGKAMKIVSGYRCEAHNKAVGSTEKSLHRLGRAADIFIERGGDRYELVDLAIAHGFMGIGVAKTFIHVDDREIKAMWIY
jgi:uncharacterized protein YcbK (DUF882 family)